jgi:hypothetical protein
MVVSCIEHITFLARKLPHSAAGFYFPPPVIFIKSGSGLETIKWLRVISYIPNTNEFHTETGSVFDTLYRNIVQYYTYPTPMISILSGSVVDALQKHRAILYMPNINDVHTEWVRCRHTTETSCNIIHTQHQWVPYWVGQLSTHYAETSCNIIHTHHQWVPYWEWFCFQHTIQKHRAILYIPNINGFHTEWVSCRHTMQKHRAILYITNTNEFHTEWVSCGHTIHKNRAILYIPNTNEFHTESGSVFDKLYRNIVQYYTYPAPMSSILSGSVVDTPYSSIAQYYTYPTPMSSILRVVLFSTHYTETSCNIIHTQHQWFPYWVGQLSTHYR